MKAKSLMIVLMSMSLAFLGCDKSPVGPEENTFWEKIGPEDASIICLAKDQNGHIYIGTGSNGIFRSVDNGDVWEQINNGLPALTQYTWARKVAVNTNNVVFAVINHYGVYRLNSNNMTWTQVNNGLPEDIWSGYVEINDIFASATNVLYAGTNDDGVYACYDNNGENWEPFNNGYEGSVSQVFKHGYSDIFFRNSGSIYVYSWYPEEKWVKTELTDLGNSISGLTANNTAYFVSTSNEIFRSGDGIHNWENLVIVYEKGYIRTIWAAPNNDIFIGVQNNFNTNERGILRSTDNGNTWGLLDNNSLPNIISSFILNSDGRLLTGTSDGVYRTTEPLE